MWRVDPAIRRREVSAVRFHLTPRPRCCSVVAGVLQEGCISIQQLEFTSADYELVEQSRHRHYSHAAVRASPDFCSKMVSVSTSMELLRWPLQLQLTPCAVPSWQDYAFPNLGCFALLCDDNHIHPHLALARDGVSVGTLEASNQEGLAILA